MVGLTVGALVVAVWCLIVVRVAPGTRFAGPSQKSLNAHGHRTLPPPLGGVGVFLGVHLGLFVEGLGDPGLLAATSLLLTLGLVDDYMGLPAATRLVVEVAAGVLLCIWADIDLGVGAVGWIACVGLVVVAVNAVNLFDGLDGLAGLTALISAVGIAALAELRGGMPWVGLIFAGALGVFVFFNWYPARIFLGDNGAYLTGMLLIYGILRASPGGSGPDIAVGLVIVGVFLVDLVATILRRAVARRPLFAGDRSHLYDRLRARGWPIPGVAVASAAVQGLFVALAIFLEVVGAGWWALGAFAGAIAVLLVVAWSTGLFQTEPD